MMHAWKGILIAALLPLAGCSRQPAGDAVPQVAGEDAVPQVTPAMVAPSDVADPAQPPSYEVSIASAAADRNKAHERCAHQPEAVRAQCEQEANAAFAEVEASLQDLRGNQQ
jgi:hypothetical protein